MYLTDTLDTEGIFRLIESVPSPKAEPFKLWLAKLGRQKVDEDARVSYEKATKKSAISHENALNYKYLNNNDKLKIIKREE